MADLVLSLDYVDVLVGLVDAGAEFVLIGGWALALHGHGRGTDDMDANKRAAGRPKDLADVEWLERNTKDG